MTFVQSSQLLSRPWQCISRQCRQCAAPRSRTETQNRPSASARLFRPPRHHHHRHRSFSTASPRQDEVSALMEASTTTTARNVAPPVTTAAPPIDFDNYPAVANQPARIIPASPSYFTASPQFNDSILLLRSLLRKYENLPTVSSDRAPRAPWLKLGVYRSNLGEPVTASRYSKVLVLLARLNKIHPKLQTQKLHEVLDRFRRPDAAAAPKPTPHTLDQDGVACGMGKRKECTATVKLVEGDGQVLINGRSLVQAFPRLHDRESALWALKITGRMDKYNVFALARGGGSTGQAESITLALGKALLVHEPALKPTLRRAGCVTYDTRHVERKKAGKLKARKAPAWNAR